MYFLELDWIEQNFEWFSRVVLSSASDGSKLLCMTGKLVGTDLRITLLKEVSSCLFTYSFLSVVTQHGFLNIYLYHSMLLAGGFRKENERNLNKSPALKNFWLSPEWYTYHKLIAMQSSYIISIYSFVFHSFIYSFIQ